MLTGLGAFAAVFVVVLFAFVGTGLANIRADSAGFCSLVAAQTHQLRRSITDCRAFHVQLNAFGHHPDVVFLRTGRGAVVANGGALQTGVDTDFVSVVIFHVHGIYRLLPLRYRVRNG